MHAKPELKVSVSTQKHVELYCHRPLIGFLAPLCYNLLLLFLCAIYGFLTRKLPENFNESWYIFVSVATTSFLWLVLLPTYFSTFYTYHQAAILGACLILNATVTLLCLFIPKLYAIYFVNDDRIKIQISGSVSTSDQTISIGKHTSKVVPSSVISASHAGPSYNSSSSS